MVLGSIVSVQIGAAFAKSAFTLTSPLAMSWLRITCAGLILLISARPDFRHKTAPAWRALAGYSLALITMNIAIYQAMARIPLGLAVTIEFLGPLTVGILTRRGWRDLIWVGLAAIGVALLGVSPGSLTWAGVGFALLAGAAWGAYILVTPSVGRHWHGAEPVTVANLTGAVVLAIPVLLLDHATLGNWHLWALAAAVGLLSSVIPYVLELGALRHLERQVFSVLMSLEPAVAALTALIILGEQLTWLEWLAMGCVIAASVGITRSTGYGASRDRSPQPGLSATEATPPADAAPTNQATPPSPPQG